MASTIGLYKTELIKPHGGKQLSDPILNADTERAACKNPGSGRAPSGVSDLVQLKHGRSFAHKGVEEEAVSVNDMSMPVDLPWKRLAVSKDMIDIKAGDLTFPQKWQSSMAVFYYEPSDPGPDYCHRRITYLKIVCTITNFQISGEDVSVLDELRKTHGEFYAWKEFQANLTQSFPCYGALLQVGVYPSPADGVALHDYPYIAGFQPRKREMYEVTTESGEVASQSQGRLNVLKGATTTQTQEHYDIDQGGGGSGAFGLFSWNGQEYTGDVNRSQSENQNVTNHDSSRERRESYAYSTNINQLYTLLQGYHLGTNRSIFFMQPRPHIQDQKFTFVQGPRRLEGVQEFFLIVDRPDTVPGICVEVALETAHAHLERSYQPRLIRLSDLYAPGNLEKTAAALGLQLGPSDPGYYAEQLVGAWFLATPRDKMWAGTWPQVPPEVAAGGIPNDVGKLLMVVEQVPDIGVEDITLIFEEYMADSGTIFVTGRRVCACVTPAKPTGDPDASGIVGDDCEAQTEDNISTCDSARRPVVFHKPYLGRSVDKGRGGKAIESRKAAGQNLLVSDINETLAASLSSPDRLAYGQMSFLDLDFVLDGLADLVRVGATAGDRQLTDVAAFRPLLERGLGRTSQVRSMLDLSRLTATELSKDMGVGDIEARSALREALLLALQAVGTAGLADRAAPNPTQGRFRARFPAERLQQMEESAGVRRRTQ